MKHGDRRTRPRNYAFILVQRTDKNINHNTDLLWSGVLLCILVGGYQHFRGIYYPHLRLYPQGRGSMFLRKDGTHLPDYTVS
jgi:hypothetical protein